MDKEEAKKFVKQTIQSGSKERIKKVLARYFEKFLKPKKDLYEEIFGKSKK